MKPPKSDDLGRELIARIRTLASELDRLGKTALEKAVEVGGLLKECKAGLDHGQWLPWLKSNFSFSDRTARNWMRISEASASGKLETVSNLTGAYRICETKKKTIPSSPFKLPLVGQRLLLISPIHGDETMAAFEPVDETFIRVSRIEGNEISETRSGVSRDDAWLHLTTSSSVNWQDFAPAYAPWLPEPLIERQKGGSKP